MPQAPAGPRPVPGRQRQAADGRRARALADRAPQLNDRGQIVGTYQDAGESTHGLLLDRGTVKNVDFPGSKETVLIAINNRGRIIGGFVDTAGKSKHFPAG